MPARRSLPRPIAKIPARQETFRPLGWDTDITVAYDTEGNAYWPVRILCAWLGVDRPTQIRKLRTHRTLSRHLEYFWVRSPTRGERETWCLHERYIGYWFGNMDDPRMSVDLDEKLREFQEEIAAFADFRLRQDRGQSFIANITVEEDLQIPQPVREAIVDFEFQIDQLKLAALQQNRRMHTVEEQVALITGVEQRFGRPKLIMLPSNDDRDDADLPDEGEDD